MGFYLPGIGEAIGGALRMKRQGELMQQSQQILKDESKPWSERVALVTAAHPELATNPQLQQMLETGRQADADKQAKAKFDLEQDQLRQNTQFQGVLAKLPPEQRAAMLRANPDMAARVVGEEWKVLREQDKAAADDANWMERFQLQEQGKNARNAATNAATVKAQQTANQKWIAQGISSGTLTPEGQPVPKAVLDKQAQELALQTDLAKKEQTVQVAEETQRKAVPALVAELESYKKLAGEEGGTGGFGADNATIQARRDNLATIIAKQKAGPGMATNKQDVEDAKALLPEPGFFTSRASFDAAMDEVIRQQKAKLIGSQGVQVD